MDHQQGGASAAAKQLSDALHQIKDPIGEGGRAWFPYSLRGEVLEQTRKLQAPLPLYEELLRTEKDPSWREVLLFLVAHTDDKRADDVLLGALTDPGTRPRAAYLLGAIGTKGWPSRARDTRRILQALLPYVDDPQQYQDVYYRDTRLPVGDLVKAAFVRLAGPEKLLAGQHLEHDQDGLQTEWIGQALPTFTAADRARLDGIIRRYAAAELGKR